MRLPEIGRALARTAAIVAVACLTLACSERLPAADDAPPPIPDVETAAVNELPESTAATLAPEPARVPLGPGRSHAATTWDTLWQMRGTFDDTLLLQPLGMHAIGTHVFVSDYGNKNIQAFNAETGERLWTAGRLGGGPHEFRRMTFFSASPALPGVSDAINRRISFVSMRGEFERESPVQLPSAENGICKLGENYFVAGTGSLNRNARLLKWTPGADTLEQLAPEWLSYLDTLDLIVGQFSLRRINESLCVIRHPVGPHDLLIFDSTLALVQRVPQRERVRAASADSTVRDGRLSLSASRSAGYGWGHPAVADGSLFVTFRNATPVRERAIDEFSLPDFTYVGTHVAPHVLRGLAGTDDRLTLLMEDTAGYYVIAQLRRRSGRRE